jgi:hypothetical protein
MYVLTNYYIYASSHGMTRHTKSCCEIPDTCTSILGQMGDLKSIWQREWMNLTR